MSHTGWPISRASAHRRRPPSTPFLRWDSGAATSSSRKLAAGLWHIRFDETSVSKPVAHEVDSFPAEERRRARELEAKNRKLRKKVKWLVKKLEEERECPAAAEERRSRRRTEAVNAALIERLADAHLHSERLSRRCSAEKKRREAAEAACQDLLADSERRLRRGLAELEEERKMLQVAEAWREERVRIKLDDARLALADSLSQINSLVSELRTLLGSDSDDLAAARELLCAAAEGIGSREVFFEEFAYSPPGSNDEFLWAAREHYWEGSPERRLNVSPASAVNIKVESAAKENPHIAMGMKGCIEWPRASAPKSVFKANVSEAIIQNQKSQLRHILKPKGLRRK